MENHPDRDKSRVRDFLFCEGDIMEDRAVPIQNILNDGTFRFARRDADKIARIAASIRESGMLEPIWVRSMPEGLQILAGFSRYEAAGQAGLSSIPVHYADADADVFCQILLAHRVSSDFNVMEKGRALRIFKRLDPVGRERIRCLRLLDLPDKPSVLNEMEELLELDPALQAYIESCGAALKQASQFLPFRTEEQRFCAEIGETLRIRPVELLSVCIPLREIARWNISSVQETWRGLGLPNVIQSEAARGQKVQEIKKRVHERRFPKLTGWNRSIEEAARSLNLPASVRIEWDRTLEAPGVEVRIHADSAKEIKHLTERLSSGPAERAFHRMFRMLS